MLCINKQNKIKWNQTKQTQNKTKQNEQQQNKNNPAGWEVRMGRVGKLTMIFFSSCQRYRLAQRGRPHAVVVCFFESLNIGCNYWASGGGRKNMADKF